MQESHQGKRNKSKICQFFSSNKQVKETAFPYLPVAELILHSPGLSDAGNFESSLKVKSLGFVMEEAVDSLLIVFVPGCTERETMH